MQNYKDLEILMNKIDMGIIISDSSGNIISINKKAEELFHPVKNDFIEFPYNFYTISGAVQAKYQFPPTNIFNLQERVINQNLLCTGKKGEQFWCNMNSFAIRDEKNTIIEIVTFINEISEKKYLEEYLQDTTKNIESILYSSNVDGSDYFFITKAVEKLLGITPEELTKNTKAILRRINPKDLPKFKKFAEQLQKGEPAIVEFQITDKWGRHHYLKNSGFPVFQDNKLVKIDGIVNDITHEKNIQLELEKSEEKYRLLIETANDLIFYLDKYGYFVTVNNYGALALGYKPEEIIGQHFLEFISDDSKAELTLTFQQILKSDRVNSFETVFLDRTGKDVIFEIQGRTIWNDGEISGMLGIGRNITLRRKDEEKLKELNSKLIEANRLVTIERDRVKQQVSVIEEVNKLKSKFISNISHELRTPLASVIGFSETISSDPEMPKEMAMEFNNIILSEGKRLAGLINNLLDFAKMEGSKIEIIKSDFDVIELLKEILKNLENIAKEKCLILTSDLPETPVILNADRERISEVYYHLIHNALKFTEKGGRVTIIAQIYLKEFEFIVSDTGIGIPAKDLTNIFQKFFKAGTNIQFPGTGIGLGLVKQIVDLHKGLISVKSEMGKGTTFIVKFPRKQE